jgi:hypothetical protein
MLVSYRSKIGVDRLDQPKLFAPELHVRRTVPLVAKEGLVDDTPEVEAAVTFPLPSSWAKAESI